MSLCNKCRHMFRVIFFDREVSEEETIIGKTCLISEWDIGSMEVYDCNKFEELNSLQGILRYER